MGGDRTHTAALTRSKVAHFLGLDWSHTLSAEPRLFFTFSSAAQTTYQGEESVLLILVVVGGDHFQSSHVQFLEV